MLPTAQRMRRAEDFRRAVRVGRRSGGRFLVIYWAGSPQARDDAPTPTPPAKVGFVLSRAVGSAVVRNLVRRRLRSLVSDLLLGIPVGSLLVIRVQPAAATASYQQLRDELVPGLRRVLPSPGREPMSATCPEPPAESLPMAAR